MKNEEEFFRNDWTRSEIKEIYQRPLLSLMHQSSRIFQIYHKPGEVQLCALLSVKTGGCSEDCAYCSQSHRHDSGVVAQKVLEEESILLAAKKAKEMGSSRFCMGAAWREIRNSRDFDRILEVASKISKMGMEVCCSMGMLTEEQAQRLKGAGVYAYNHNLDTGPNYYEKIISTRTYEDRLKTLEIVCKVGLKVCCGGILGMGESEEDRMDLLHMLSTMPEHPESVPINVLLPVKGTKMEDRKALPIWELLRVLAVSRILMPKAKVRLSAGRASLSHVEQALCFMVGANSIHIGEKLLTMKNCSLGDDRELMDLLGIVPMNSALEPLEAVF